MPRLAALGLKLGDGSAAARSTTRHSTHQMPIVPARARATWPRSADTVRGYKKRARAAGAAGARDPAAARQPPRMLTEAKPDKAQRRRAPSIDLAERARGAPGPDAPSKLLAQWPEMQKAYAGDEYVVKIRDKEIRTALDHHDAVGHQDPQGRAARSTRTTARSCKWLMLDNVPGSFPYTAGTFAFKREGEDPTRMFAGEGDAFRTNTRFKLLSSPACRPSACRPRSTRSRCTATTRDRGPTSTARSATRASRSPRWTT